MDARPAALTVPALVLASVLLSGCATLLLEEPLEDEEWCYGCHGHGANYQRRTIRAKEMNSTLRSGRLSVALVGRNAGLLGNLVPWENRKPQPELAIDLDYAAWTGSDRQYLHYGQAIELDGIRGVGPGYMRYHFELERLLLAARGGGWFGRAVGIQAMIGWCWTRRHLEVHGPNNEYDWRFYYDKDDHTGHGPMVGGRLACGLVPAFEIYGQGWGCYRANPRPGWTFEAELGAEVTAFGAVGLYAGWRRLQYVESNTHKSDMSLRVSGPTLGVRLTF